MIRLPDTIMDNTYSHLPASTLADSDSVGRSLQADCYCLSPLYITRHACGVLNAARACSSVNCCEISRNQLIVSPTCPLLGLHDANIHSMLNIKVTDLMLKIVYSFSSFG